MFGQNIYLNENVTGIETEIADRVVGSYWSFRFQFIYDIFYNWVQICKLLCVQAGKLFRTRHFFRRSDTPLLIRGPYLQVAIET